MAIGKTNAVTIIGGTPPPTTGDYKVRYFDVDGSILKEQWINSGENPTAPENPNFDQNYITFDSWNQVTTNINSHRNVGAQYTTVNGKSYAFFTLTVVTGLTLPLYLKKNNSATLSVEWGDGITTTHTNSGSFNTSHTYSTYGNYVVSIWISSGTGTYTFGNGDLATVFSGGSLKTYKDALTKLYMGLNVSDIPDYAFSGCYSLGIVVISSSVTLLGQYSFNADYSLRHLTIPNSVTTLNASCLASCISLNSVSIPTSITTIGSGVFTSDTSLDSLVLLGSITSIPDNTCYNCYSVSYVYMTNTVTSIGAYAFNNCQSLEIIILSTAITSIANNSLQYCYSLSKLSISSTVTSILNNAFAACFGVKQYKFYRTTPTTITSTNTFNTLNKICKIYVPDASLSAYKSATNWSTFANYIYPLSEIGE